MHEPRPALNATVRSSGAIATEAQLASPPFVDSNVQLSGSLPRSIHGMSITPYELPA